MNDDEKRFKQINRVATPIQVNQNNTVQEVKQEQVVESTSKNKKKRLKLHINPVLVLKILIGILIVGNIACLVIILFPNRITYDYRLKYNDVPAEEEENKNYFFINKKLISADYLTKDKEYKIIDGLKIELRGRDVLVNSVNVASADKLSSSVALIDDLVLFTTENEGIRSKTLYAVDTKGNKYLEIYHISNGKVLTGEVEYGMENITIKTSNVNADLLYLDNTIGSLNPISVCDLETLASKSINLSSSVITHYSIEYLGNHKFSEPTSTYEMSLNDYRTTNNYCN